MKSQQLRPVIDIYEENAEFWSRQRSQSSFFEHKYMSQILRGLQNGDELLDLGCGTGEPIAAYFIQNSIQVTGVDASKNMIQMAQSKYPNGHWIVV